MFMGKKKRRIQRMVSNRRSSSVSRRCRTHPRKLFEMMLSEIERMWWEHQQYIETTTQILTDRKISTLPDYFDAIVEESPQNLCLWSVETNEKLTYLEVQERANRVARWARQVSVVGLMMPNCNDFVWLCLGLSKAGYVISLFNISFKHDLLEHACKLSDVQHLIIERSVFENLNSDDKIWLRTRSISVWDKIGSSSTAFSDLADLQSFNVVSGNTFVNPCVNYDSINLPSEWRSEITQHDDHFHIFTSGTTGKSKAARFSHRRFIGAGVTWAKHMNLTREDIYYVTLPLFHGNGGVVALSAAWKARCCILVRSKFSASQFWSDIRRFKATATIYVGELWQYVCRGGRNGKDAKTLLEDERSHSLRVVCGNGLRPELWKEIEYRFGIKLIVEHYGQTEMPAAHPMINSYGKVGSCGFIPLSVSGNFGTETLIQFDADTNQPLRVPCIITAEDRDIEFMSCVKAPIDKDGNQIGEAIVKLNGPYSGYTSLEDTQQVIYRDVFELGDSWYHSGDILRRDCNGFYYFVDRTGDTFRWKGHNVSTHEVADIISRCPHVIEANVYGVEIPGGNYSGKVGMAALLFDDSISFDNIQDKLDEIKKIVDEALPEYARPKFIRVTALGNTKTATLKFQKSKFVAQGFDETKIHTSSSPSDLLFWNYKNSFIRLTKNHFIAICIGDVVL